MILTVLEIWAIRPGGWLVGLQGPEHAARSCMLALRRSCPRRPSPGGFSPIYCFLRLIQAEKGQVLRLPCLKINAFRRGPDGAAMSKCQNDWDHSNRLRNRSFRRILQIIGAAVPHFTVFLIAALRDPPHKSIRVVRNELCVHHKRFHLPYDCLVEERENKDWPPDRSHE